MTDEAQHKQVSRVGIGTGALILTLVGAVIILFAFFGATDICSGTGTGCNASAIVCDHGDSIFILFAAIYVLIFPLAYALILLKSLRWWRRLFALHIIYLVATTAFWALPFLSVPLSPCFGALHALYTMSTQL